jgi:integrase
LRRLSRSIGTITRADIQSLVDSWSGKQAPSTISRQYSCLRAICTWAETADIIMRNPCRSIRLPQVRLVDRPNLTVEQLEQLAYALGPGHAPMMRLGVVLGLRWAETAGLSVDRIAFGGGTVTVDRQLARTGSLEVPKSAAGTRTLACPAWLLDELARLLARRGLTVVNGDSLRFVTAGGEPLDYTNWRRRIWSPACAEAKLPRLRFHDLRSLAATALVVAGVDVKTAQTRLGHSSPHVTLALYARATAAADRKAAEAVGEVFRPLDRRAMDLP